MPELEKLLAGMDTWRNITFRNETNPKIETVIKAGLNVRYSPSRETWYCYYGKKVPSAKFVGKGATPLEAVQEFLKLDK